MRRILATVLATALVADPALATHRHHAAATHSRQDTHAHTEPHRPAGVVTVPASGLKIFCAGRRSPLLVRKFTQGAGTTVTVLCR